MVPKVNTNFELVDADDNVIDVTEEGYEEKLVEVPRNDLMRALFSEGIERSKIKDYFNVPYATVYAATKDTDAPEGTVRGGKKMLTHPETKKEISRADYIRELYADGEGMTRKDIALKLTQLTGELVDYAAVWSATKPAVEKEEETAEKGAESVENEEVTPELEADEEVAADEEQEEAEDLDFI